MYTLNLSERGVLLLYSALMSFKFIHEGNTEGASLCTSSALELMMHMEPEELGELVHQLGLESFKTPLGLEVLHQDTGLN